MYLFYEIYSDIKIKDFTKKKTTIKSIFIMSIVTNILIYQEINTGDIYKWSYVKTK